MADNASLKNAYLGGKLTMVKNFKRINCDLFDYAFNSWLNSRIPEGEYSAAGRAVFGTSHADPQKAYRRRKNSNTSWKLQELCCLACYLNIDLVKMMEEIPAIYRLIRREIKSKGKKKISGALYVDF